MGTLFEIRRGSPTGPRVWVGTADNWLKAVDQARLAGISVALGNTTEADYVVEVSGLSVPHRFINLTPHEITLSTAVGGIILPSLGVARATETRTWVARLFPTDPELGLHDSLDVERVTYGNVVGLPGPADGCVYIVSQIVANAVPGRRDVVYPGRLIRDDQGRPTGCTSLSCAWWPEVVA